MKTFTTVAALAALSSTAFAATVTIKETPCLQESVLEQYIVELDKLVVQEMSSVCGLEIVSASDDIDISKITCQAFQDAAGLQPGSAKFTSANPAFIATNPVQEASILCEVQKNAKQKRQNSSTVTIKETACLQESELEEYTIEVGTLVVQEMKSVCGLEIVSASNADVESIVCQAFSDAAGTQPGSAEFSFGNSAQIATNPVQEASIFCKVKGEEEGGQEEEGGNGAAIVTIKETACLQESELEEYTIEIGKLVVQEMKSVCGLEIVSATNADVKTITCQAFKNVEGTESGSAPFTVDKPASIATNPVQIAGVGCFLNIDDQGEGDPAVTTDLATVVLPTATGTGAAGANGTAITTGAPGGQPTETGYNGPYGENAAGRVEWSWTVGAVLAVGAAVFGM